MYNLFYHLFRNIILNRYQKHKKKIIYISLFLENVSKKKKIKIILFF